jgi:hypothetical protein
MLLILIWTTPALACTPPPGGLPVYTIAQRVAAADVVLEGTVTSLATASIPDDTATIAVQHYFKGTGASNVTIVGFGPSSFCRSQVQVGEHLIFFAKHTASGLAASYLGQFDATAPATQEVIDAILLALGQTPRAFLPLVAASASSHALTHTVLPSRVPASPAWSILLVASSALALVVGLAWRWRAP